MKRIEFIAPVEAMRGNLSGNQVLEYPENSNPAFYAPSGKHYATNYQPRFIGAKRAATGLKYFSVKTKSAINKTAASTLSMAVLGAAGAMFAAIIADKTSELYQKLYTIWSHGVTKDGRALTFREMVMSNLTYMLRNKDPYWEEVDVPPFYIKNPFVTGEAPSQGSVYEVTISNDILVKFWSVLANNPITFTVAGQKGIAHSGDKFSGVIASGYNVLGLKVNEHSANEFVGIGSSYVMGKAKTASSWFYVFTNENVESEATYEYTLVPNAPSA